MAFKLNNLPKRTEKPRSNRISLVLDKGLSVRKAEVIPLETLRLGLRSVTLFGFYSIDDDVEDLYSNQKSASQKQN
jgi:phosphosulfolactate synthase (CoM biosynthesis protein A)